MQIYLSHEKNIYTFRTKTIIEIVKRNLFLFIIEICIICIIDYLNRCKKMQHLSQNLLLLLLLRVKGFSVTRRLDVCFSFYPNPPTNSPN